MSRDAARDRGEAIASLYGKSIRVLGVGLQATDAVVVAAILLFSALTVVYHGRVPGAGTLLLKNAVCGMLYFGATALYQRLNNRLLRFLVRTASVQLLFAQLFLLVLPLQLTLVTVWQDGVVLSLEHAVFGVQPVVWLQRFVSFGLTEWMMVSYVMYLVIYPVLSGVFFYRRGEQAMEDYLFTLAVANVLCDIGFIIFPVASPYYNKEVRDLLTVPLKGSFFTACGEYIRTNIHQIGGSLPSPHCAIATVMWMMARRYYRPAFWVLAPIILSLYVSTFYLRYHYVSDSVAGILTAAVVMLVAPAMVRIWNGGADRLGATAAWKY